MKSNKNEGFNLSRKGKLPRQTSAAIPQTRIIVPKQSTIDIISTTDEPTSSKAAVAVISKTSPKATTQERRASLQKTVALKSGDMLAIQLDPEEVSMLRSMQKSSRSQKSRDGKGTLLHQHEFEDLTEESDQDEEGLSSSHKSNEERKSKTSISEIHRMEWRQRGMRHEKMRSNTKSKELVEEGNMPGLVYDPDFDCYYDPKTDQYYRLEPLQKPE